MCEVYQVIVLALVQGLTEFLPISSSAHLILVPALLKWPDPGLAFDIAVHVGTLSAVILYFRRDLMRLCSAFINSCCSRTLTPDAKIVWGLGLATIPVGLTGLLLKKHIETSLRSPLIIALTTIVFGLLLWFADKTGKQSRNFTELNWRNMGLIGCSQALSLLPGTSRSGITLTAGLLTGLTREAAARFSFLLAIPVIILAGGLQGITLWKSFSTIDWRSLGLGAGVSALSGYVCIHYFIRWINKAGVLPFVIYRMFLGLFLIVYFYCLA